jgi:hypothetical protein
MEYKRIVKTGAQKGLEMKMSGQAKGACFNKAVDSAIARGKDLSDEDFIELVVKYFEAFKPINIEESEKPTPKQTEGPF